MAGKNRIIFILSIVTFLLVCGGAFWYASSRTNTPHISRDYLTTYTHLVPVAVIGSGPAGLTAALYTARAHLPTTVFSGPDIGGQLTEARLVENWPAKPKERGAMIMQEMENQVKHFGAHIDHVSVTHIDFSHWPYELTLDNDKKVQALSVILATGGSQMKLDIPGVEKYWGKGIGVCTICDAPFDKGKEVAIIGDSDIACDMALQLREFAQHVYVCVPKERMDAAAVNQEYLNKAENISVLLNTNVSEIKGDGKQLTGIILTDQKTGQSRTLPVESFYFAIGFKPNSDLVKGKLKTDRTGYVVVSPRKGTSKPLVYAAGTIIDPLYQKGLISSAMGAEAAISLIEDIQDAGFNPQLKTQLSKNLYEVEKLPVEIETIATPDELAKILKQNELVLVNFFGPSCPACKAMLPVLQRVAYEMEGIVTFVNFNIQEMQDVVELFDLHYKPTLILFKKGRERERSAGALTKEKLIEFINENK